MILKFKPIFLRKVWGGNKLSKIYNLKTADQIGECWGISGHKSYSNIVESGDFKGKTLSYLYKNYSELFGNCEYEEFPILIKVIDAKEDLSVQVHPTNTCDKQLDNQYAKDECWYVLDSKPNSEIIIGHNADRKEDLIDLIYSSEFSKLLKRYPISKGDYFYIPAGTIHSICKNTFILEVSQSSDVTYRIYDYKRLEKGRLRDIHISKALEYTTVPDNKLLRIHQNKYFTFEIKENNGRKKFMSNIYGDYISVIKGEGYIGNHYVKNGDFLMISSNSEYAIEGNVNYHISTIL